MSPARHTCRCRWSGSSRHERSCAPAGGAASRQSLVSKEDFDSWHETSYLLQNPANARRLVAANERAEVGEHEEHVLVEP